MYVLVYTVCHLANEQSPLGIRHPWFLKPWAVVPYPLPVPLCIRLFPSLALSSPDPQPSPRAQRPSYPSQIPSTFAAFTLTLPLSLLSPSTPSILYLCFSFPRAAPACQFFLSPYTLLHQLSSTGPAAPHSRPRLLRLSHPPPPHALPIHGRPRTAPSQKTQVQCGRNGGFLPSPPFTLFPSYIRPSLASPRL